MALTDKQEMFCREYLVDLNATQAAIRAGYSAKTANRTGSENLSKHDIAQRINDLKSARIERVELNADYVLKRLFEIDQMDVLDIMTDDMSIKPVSDWPTSWRQYLSGFDLAEMFEGRGEEREMVGILKKIKWPDKVRNLELLGKHISVQAFREQSTQALTGKDGGPVEVALLTREEYRQARREMLEDDDC
ncbi:terminase small subunit [Pantoea sp. BS_4]|uniref:terminase small subunit n=1 Tax=Pantoea TaxID=53335 RepID=UPI001562B05F|nr:terminase small subunit [Pantoea stewartii]NRH24673.1 terminase [Pantoea stewartii]